MIGDLKLHDVHTTSSQWLIFFIVEVTEAPSVSPINTFSVSQKYLLDPLNHIDFHYDVTQWERFPRYGPFVRGIQGSPVDSHHKGPVTRLHDCFTDSPSANELTLCDTASMGQY